MIDQATVKEILPVTGKSAWGEMFLSQKCVSSGDALKLYQYLKLSLLDVSNWNRHKPGLSLRYRLMDQNGTPVGRIAQTGDRLKVVLTKWHRLFYLPGLFEIERIEERLDGDTEYFFFTMGSSFESLVDMDKDFQNLKTTVTIFIIRDDKKVELQIHSYDYTINSSSESLRDKMAKLMGLFLLRSGFYKNQWVKLLKVLLEDGLSLLTNLN